MPVYSNDYWNSDKWDPMDYGKDYDFSKPFFEQYLDLSNKVPRFNCAIINSIDCDYCSKITNSKNCYLCIAYEAENDLYGNYSRITHNCVDYYFMTNSDWCYESIHCSKCTNVKWSLYSFECRDSSFLFDCKNCSDCFGCAGLRNKKYCIYNKSYTKEEYFEKIKELDIGGYKFVESSKKRLKELAAVIPRRFMISRNSPRTTGNHLEGLSNCTSCFDAEALGGSIVNCKYINVVARSIKDSYDVLQTGEGTEPCYFSVATWGFRDLFSVSSSVSSELIYCDMCRGSSHLFGCIALRNKQYCILNKQYTKEEYEELVPRIIKHMNDMPYVDKKGRVYRYGEFFPPELSPFAYNETIAQEYFPLTKDEAIKQGYRWKDPEPRNYEITKTPDQLPDHIKDVPDSITSEIIGCSHEGKCNEQCTTAFKIIKEELQFYRRMNLPLPRLCPNCRHYQRLKQRNPLKLWHRKCQCAGPKSENGVYANTIPHQHGTSHCPNEFETSYAPERKEIVYCESCYNSEVV